MKPIAYVASPFGFSEAGRLFLDIVLMPLITEVEFEVVRLSSVVYSSSG